MKIVSLVVPQAEFELALAELYGLGTAGVQEKDVPGEGVRLDAWFEEDLELGWLSQYSPVWTDAPTIDWAEDWRRAWQPLLVGERFFVVPDWMEDAAPEGRLRLTVRPAQASGSGYHAPTQLALAALEGAVSPGNAVLDVGTGSGILSRAALLLGAARVVGCDVDESVLSEVKDLPVFVGSARAVKAEHFDCVVANLNAEALLALSADLRRVVRPGGRLVVAGFKERRVAELRRAFEWTVEAESGSAEWRCLVFVKAVAG